MSHGPPPNDPGWRPRSLKRLLLLIVAPYALGHGRDAAGTPRVLALRTALIAFLTSFVLLGVVLSVLFPVTSEGPVDPVGWLLLGVGAAAALGGSTWAARRELPCDDLDGLAGHYSTGFFLGVAFSDVAALLGFVASFLVEAIWPYLIGLLVTGLGLWRVAPTAGRIARRDEQLRTSGCPHSLRDALYRSPDDDTSR